MLHQKYDFPEADADAIAAFMLPMLDWDPERRASAEASLRHPWLANVP